MKQRKHMPYVRKINGKEKTTDSFLVRHLAFYSKRGGYVMVQHGFPNIALAVGESKQAVKDKIYTVALGLESFKQWARKAKRQISNLR